MRANPELARRIAAAGHLIANHSNFHAPMDGLDDELLRRDVRKAEDTIRATTGVDPKPWFRCPFGAGMDDERVLAALEQLGYRHVGWDADPEDWNEEHGADEIERLVLQGVRARDGDTIVLLHGWPMATAEARPARTDMTAHQVLGRVRGSRGPSASSHVAGTVLRTWRQRACRGDSPPDPAQAAMSRGQSSGPVRTGHRVRHSVSA